MVEWFVIDFYALIVALNHIVIIISAKVLFLRIGIATKVTIIKVHLLIVFVTRSDSSANK